MIHVSVGISNWPLWGCDHWGPSLCGEVYIVQTGRTLWLEGDVFTDTCTRRGIYVRRSFKLQYLSNETERRNRVSFLEIFINIIKYNKIKGATWLKVALVFFLANLSQRPKWVFLIKICPLSVVVNVSYFHLLLQNHWVNFTQTWHKGILEKSLTKLFKWRTSSPLKGR